MEDWLWLWIVLGIIAAVVIGVAIWYVVCYNRFIRLKNDIEEAKSNVDVYLKQRFDLVPNLVATVKGYASHEDKIFDRVTKARESVMRAQGSSQRAAGEEELSSSLRGLLAVAEAYPDLKANQNFMQLQSQLETVEADLASARRYYNANVKLFNTMLLTWPSRVIARKQGFEKEPLFETDEAEKRNVRVQF